MFKIHDNHLVYSILRFIFRW